MNEFIDNGAPPITCSLCRGAIYDNTSAHMILIARTLPRARPRRFIVCELCAKAMSEFKILPS